MTASCKQTPPPRLFRPKKMPATQKTGVPLSCLIEEGMRLFVCCVKCHHHGLMDVAPLIARLGSDYPIPRVANKLVCTQCGAQDFTVNPN